tara:strand:- start:1801 stop:2337 length:537 start_codon:yes stop_codon:yes gene_type:complete
MNFKNFILHPPVELIKEISDLKNLFFEIKEGKEFGIKLTNKNTSEYWISSTNKIQQREKDLKYFLTKRDEWNGPWKDIFSNIPGEKILDDIEFQYIQDINLIDSQELFYQNFSTTIDLDKIKVSFMSLLRAYLKNIKTDQTLQSNLRELVEDFFKPKKEIKSLKLMNLVEEIDLLINS